MSKVLFINGSPNEHGCTSTAMEETIRVLKENGIETETLWLGKKPMADCVACGTCQTTGKCVFDDEVNAVAGRIDEFDGIVVGSPVYYGGPNGRLTSFLDRLCFSVPGEKLNGKLAASNQYFLMTNMHVVASQYWNQIHGHTAEEARQDEEGLQTMRTLGRNMAWLLKAIEKGEEAGVERPVHEPMIPTNFIR